MVLRKELQVLDIHADKSRLAEFAFDVKKGLGRNNKYLLPKYFYDKIGSQLFEEITRQPEYYLTGIETDIIRQYSNQIFSVIGEGKISLVEFGSGSSTKTRILLENILAKERHGYYFPIDISSDFLKQTVNELSTDFPHLTTVGIAENYIDGIDRINECISRNRSCIPEKKLVLFLGSSIGNFDPKEARDFLQNVRKRIGHDDYFLVGFDLKKEEQILTAAYNDKARVTEKFNLNILSRINRELGGDFDLDAFSHLAFYNNDESRIEMHLVSKKKQHVYLPDTYTTFIFEKDEKIHTENSYKYTIEDIDVLADKCEFKIQDHFQDHRKWFDLALMRPA